MTEPAWIRAANRLLSPLELRVVPTRPEPAQAWSGRLPGEYVSDREALARAARAGLSIGEHLEQEFGRPGRAREILERMGSMDALRSGVRRVLEIGPGTGIFTEGVVRLAAPDRYEIYELDRRRAARLARALGVVPCPTDGSTLAATPDASVDLVHAHGLFVELDFLPSHAYFEEMARVTAPGGRVVFDLLCEECLGDEELARLTACGWSSPSFMAKDHALEVFRRAGLEPVGEFSAPMLECGRSRYVVLARPGSRAEGDR